jgi:hypothetical protein
MFTQHIGSQEQELRAKSAAHPIKRWTGLLQEILSWPLKVSEAKTKTAQRLVQTSAGSGPKRVEELQTSGHLVRCFPRQRKARASFTSG